MDFGFSRVDRCRFSLRSPPEPYNPNIIVRRSNSSTLSLLMLSFRRDWLGLAWLQYHVKYHIDTTRIDASRPVLDLLTLPTRLVQ